MSRAAKITLITILAAVGVILTIIVVLGRIASDYISATKAEEILLNRHPDAYVSEIDLENKGTKVFYEIEFTKDNSRHIATVDGKTGEIVSDSARISPTREIPAVFDVESATQKALADAGLSESDVSITKAESANDNGKEIYRIEFTNNGTVYEYKIDKETGMIESISTENTN